MIRSVINSIFRTIIITGNTGPVLQAYASMLALWSLPPLNAAAAVAAAADQKAAPLPPVTIGRRAAAAYGLTA
jgi:hypothetical protein